MEKSQPGCRSCEGHCGVINKMKKGCSDRQVKKRKFAGSSINEMQKVFLFTAKKRGRQVCAEMIDKSGPWRHGGFACFTGLNHNGTMTPSCTKNNPHAHGGFAALREYFNYQVVSCLNTSSRLPPSWMDSMLRLLSIAICMTCLRAAGMSAALISQR
jgi:hypothetical protein